MTLENALWMAAGALIATPVAYVIAALMARAGADTRFEEAVEREQEMMRRYEEKEPSDAA